MLDNGDDIPDPVRSPRKEKNVYGIEPDPKVASPILVKKTRLSAGMTLEELAGKAGSAISRSRNGRSPERTRPFPP